MMTYRRLSILPKRVAAICFFILGAALLIPLVDIQAQAEPAVQELHGTLSPGQVDVYRLNNLKQGEKIDLLMQTTSGNLDPLLAIVPVYTDLTNLFTSYSAAVKSLIATSPQPLLDLPALRDKTFLAWDDDSGPGYAAAVEFSAPVDGDYYLLAAPSLSSAGRQTGGSYRLLAGKNSAGVLDGTSVPNGATLVVPDQAAMASPLVQELTGSLNQDKPSTFVNLAPLKMGDTLYVNLQATSGGLKPVVVLRDYGHKPVRVANLTGGSSTASFQQAFPEGGENFFLEINSTPPGGQQTSGDFRLQVGVNAPEVLTGQAQPNSESVLQLPIPVQVGLKLQQIVAINQQDEIMNDVGTLKLEWTDPALAFNPDECDCYSKQYTENSFAKFLEDVKGKWPDFTFFNQQGNRWTQNRLIEIESNGHVTYLERFSTDFQLDFDWSG
jgi:hypothetical protein